MSGTLKLNDTTFATESGGNISATVNSLDIATTMTLPRLASDPANPIAGQIYYNTTDNVIKHYDETNWDKISNNNPTFTGTITGEGIKFSLDTSASILDNYDKGTWTGTLQMHSSYSNTGSTDTNITATGNYILVGDLCQVDIYFDVKSYSNYVAKNITGLPFTSVDSGSGQPLSMGHQRGIRFVYSTTIHTAMVTSARVNKNSTDIALQTSYNGSAFSGWYYISNESSQGKYIHVGGSYRIA